MGMIVHFVLIGQWFPYAFYLSVMSVKKVLNPDKIYIWTTDFLKGNKWWDLTEPIVDRQLVKIPELSFPNNWAQYQIGTIRSNCIRLEKLYEYGGVYLDFDTFTIKDFSGLLEGYEVVIPRNLDCKISDYNNNVLMAIPKSEIIKKAINNTREWRKKGILSFIDTARVPYRHLDTGPVNISWIADNIKPDRVRKCPYQFFQYPNPINVMNPGKNARSIYVMHFGASVRRNAVKGITPDWIENSDSLYAKAVKRVLTENEWMRAEMKELNQKEAAKYIEKSIIGALSQTEGELLYDLARHCMGKGVIVEIGSLLGKSTAYLGLGSKAGVGVKIYAIDPFNGGDSVPKSKGIKDIIAKGNYLPRFQANIKRVGLSDIVVPVAKRSMDAVSLIKEPIELIFIDGAHEYEFVKSDFLQYFPKVVSGGIIAFHDRNRSGVKQMINKYVMPNTNIVQIKTCGSILYCKKKEKL